MKICPCGSMQTYESCCAPFHQGVLPKKAVELMRSRYSAYALHLPDYIIETTHLDSPSFLKDPLLWRREITEFSRGTRFEKLEILHAEEKEDKGTVVFRAHLFQGNNNVSFQEDSSFLKVNGKWLYLNGFVSSFNPIGFTL